MQAKKIVLAAALLAALPAFAAEHQPKSTQDPSAQSGAAMTSGTNAPAASTNQPAASASTNQPAASTGQAAAPMPSYEQKTNSASAAGDESVRQLQQSLKDKGFDPGPVDGVMGPRTQAALDKSKSGASASSADTSASTSQPSASASTSQPSASASTNQPSAATGSNATKQ